MCIIYNTYIIYSVYIIKKMLPKNPARWEAYYGPTKPCPKMVRSAVKEVHQPKAVEDFILRPGCSYKLLLEAALSGHDSKVCAILK